MENNKLIADFMEIPHCDRCKDCGLYKFGIGMFYSPEQMQYHKSWDWLMPVVEKIETMDYGINIIKGYCSVRHQYSSGPTIADFECDSKIEATYKSIIAFIKWYNINQSNQTI